MPQNHPEPTLPSEIGSVTSVEVHSGTWIATRSHVEQRLQTRRRNTDATLPGYPRNWPDHLVRILADHEREQGVLVDALSRAVLNPPQVAGLPRVSPMRGLDRRRLRPVDVLGQSIAAVAPSGAAATFPLLISGVAGSGLIFSMLLALGVLLLVTASINQFARRIVAPGGLYTFTALGSGPAAAFLAAASLLTGYAFVVAFALAGSARSLQLVGTRVGADIAGDWSALVVVTLGTLCLVVVVVGVRISTRVTLVIEAVSFTAISVLVVALIVRVGWQGPRLAFSAPPDVPVIAIGAALAVVAFVGFESAVTLGVEARRPRATVPRVLLWTVVGTGALYVLSTYGQYVGLTAVGKQISDSTSPADDLARAYGVDWVGIAIDASIATSFLAAAFAHTNALARVLLALARDGVAPAALGRVHRRLQTPWLGVCVSVPVITGATALLPVFGADLWQVMQTTIVTAATGFLLAYLLVCAAVPRFLDRVGERTRGPVVVSAIATVALGCGLATYLVAESMNGSALGVGLFAATTLAAFAWFRARARNRPESGAGIGTYDLAVEADLLGGSG